MKFYLAFFLITIYFNIHSQEHDSRIRISEFHLQGGFLYSPIESGSLEDFKKLAPQSVLLKNDFSTFKASNTLSSSRSNIESIQLGILFKNKQNPLLRIGLSHLNYSSLHNNYRKEESFHIDTLTSSQTGQQTFIDSVSSQNYSMDFSSQEIRFDASLIFRTDAAARMSLFGGFGFSIGTTYKTNTTISYGLDNSSQETYWSGNSSIESFTTKNFLTSTLYVPMGLDFRIGKNNAFLKRLHVYYEMKPSFFISSIPELRTFTNVNFIQVLGLKVAL